MKQVGRSKTSIEREVKYVLNRLGFRCHLTNNHILGKPDIVIRRAKTAIFVNGCFWHGHEACQKGLKRPRKNAEYWEYKIERNKTRDQLVTSELQRSGWRVVTVWECSILKPNFQTRLDQSLSDTTKCISLN